MRLVLRAALFILGKVKLQHVLYLTAFILFGVGDGITSAYMMNVKGPYSEANPIIRDMFINLGFEGMVMVKVWATLMMLVATYIVRERSRDKMYWTINGFLLAHIIAGLIGINANLNALSGAAHPEAGYLLLAYVVLVLVLTEAGSFADKYAG